MTCLQVHVFLQDQTCFAFKNVIHWTWNEMSLSWHPKVQLQMNPDYICRQQGIELPSPSGAYWLQSCWKSAGLAEKLSFAKEKNEDCDHWASGLAGVCSGYKTLTVNLAISKLPEDTAGNTDSLGSTHYGLNCVPSKFSGWSPNPLPQDMTRFGDWVFKEVIKVKVGQVGPNPIPSVSL